MKRHISSPNQTVQKVQKKKKRFNAQLPKDLDPACALIRKDIELQLVDQLGEGGTANVYEVVCTLQNEKKLPNVLNVPSLSSVCGGSPLVLKVIHMVRTNEPMEKQVQKEFEAARVAAQVGLGPAVFDAWICSSFASTFASTPEAPRQGLILLERIPNIVHPKDWATVFTPAEQLEMMGSLVQRMRKFHAKGWTHGDITEDNLVLTTDKKSWILDYGSAQPVPKKSPPGEFQNFDSAKDIRDRDGYGGTAREIFRYVLDQKWMDENEPLTWEEFNDVFAICYDMNLFELLPTNLETKMSTSGNRLEKLEISKQLVHAMNNHAISFRTFGMEYMWCTKEGHRFVLANFIDRQKVQPFLDKLKI